MARTGHGPLPELAQGPAQAVRERQMGPKQSRTTSNLQCLSSGLVFAVPEEATRERPETIQALGPHRVFRTRAQGAPPPVGKGHAAPVERSARRDL
eukprot:7693634-Alexandrium_andersonii.AAC.1